MVNGKFGPGWTGEVDEGQEMSGVALVENQGGLRCHLHPFYVHALCRRHARGVFCTRRLATRSVKVHTVRMKVRLLTSVSLFSNASRMQTVGHTPPTRGHILDHAIDG